MILLLLWLGMVCGSLETTKDQKNLRGHLNLQRLLHDNYNPRVSPPANVATDKDGRVGVSVDMNIHSLENFDIIAMRYDIQMTLTQYWKDSRLAWGTNNSEATDFVSEWDNTIALSSDRDTIWRPDTYIENAKSSHKDRVATRITPKGYVKQSERLTLTLACDFDLRMYPFDVQCCHVDLASFDHSDKDIAYFWYRYGHLDIVPWTKVDWTFPPFFLIDFKTREQLSDKYTNASTVPTSLRLYFKLGRIVSHSIMQVFIPSAMLVVVSWVSFWLDRSFSSARVAVSLSTLLTLAVYSAILNSHLPAVTYIKALDVWIGICLFFIFATLVEYVIVCCLAKRQAKNFQSDSATASLAKSTVAHEAENLLNASLSKTNRANTIDVISRIVFPVTFVIFNIIFWTYWLRKSFYATYEPIIMHG